jgi:hypothetical protein
VEVLAVLLMVVVEVLADFITALRQSFLLEPLQ